MLQWFIRFPELAELTEFNESSASFRENSIDSLLNRTLRSDKEGVGCVVQHGSSDADRVPNVPDAAYCTHIVRRPTNQIPAILIYIQLE